MLSKSILPTDRAQPHQDGPLTWVMVWHRLVNMHSQLSFSDTRTKLFGISGIAREFEALSGDSYIAGLWQDNFVNDLLWYTDDPSLQRTDDLDAFTWSWTSINSVVKHLCPIDLFGNFVTTIDVQAAASDSISCEPGSNACVKLNGYLLPILPGHFTINSIFLDCRDDTTEVHHFCMPLRLQRLDQHYHLCGLVLRSVEEAFTSTYERIGMFCFGAGDEVHIASH
jgi:hypothetical protein